MIKIGDRVKNEKTGIIFIVDKIEGNKVYEDDSDDGGKGYRYQGKIKECIKYPYKLKEGDVVKNKEEVKVHIYRDINDEYQTTCEDTNYNVTPNTKPHHIIPAGTIGKVVNHNCEIQIERVHIKFEGFEFTGGGWDHIFDLKELMWLDGSPIESCKNCGR